MVNSSAGSLTRRYPGPPLPSPDHIRLVFLHPGDDDSIITCSLQTAELHSAPEYEALSYTWGDPLDCRVIYIKGSGTREREEFPVTRNCFSALRRLRLKDRIRVLWIDALGIDQSNLPERNHQVTLMSRIFSQAARVAIYLGEAGDDSDLAIDMITDCDDPRTESTALSFPKTERLVRALVSFFRRPWFTRVWIIQEAVLSSSGTVYCGGRSLSWSAVKNYQACNTGSKWHAELPFVVTASMERLITNSIESSMYKALVKTRQCEATDPRDKVYSLLPLLHSFDRQLGVIPSYGDPVAKVYTDVAVALMADCGFQLLRAVQGSSLMEGLPSWVPDWSVPPKRKMMSTDRGVEREWEQFWKKQERADVPRGARIVVDEKASRLRLAGIRCGKIEKLGSVYLAGKGQLPLEEWEDLRPPPQSRGLWHRNEAFYLVLISSDFAYFSAISLFLHNEEESEKSSPGKSWESRVRHLTLERSKTSNPDGKEDDSYVLPLGEIPFHLAGKGLVPSYRICVQMTLRNCHSRRFFVTDGGLMGMAPAEARAGDDVYMCVGATPFVLRSVLSEEKSEKQFRLVGECFLEQRAWESMEVDDLEYLEVI